MKSFGHLHFLASFPVSMKSSEWTVEIYEKLLGELYYRLTQEELALELRDLEKIANQLRQGNSVYQFHNLVVGYNLSQTGNRSSYISPYIEQIPKLSHKNYIRADFDTEYHHVLRVDDVNNLIIDNYQKQKNLRLNQFKINLSNRELDPKSTILDWNPCGEYEKDCYHVAFLQQIQKWLMKHLVEFREHVDFYKKNVIVHFDQFELVVYFPILTVPMEKGKDFNVALNLAVASQQVIGTVPASKLSGLLMGNGKNLIPYSKFNFLDLVEKLENKLIIMEQLIEAITEVEVKFVTHYL
ncbi:hypothetical protein [Risungbinella massiliensis]|uniref:hypothetical protein n=1 Tax=Risungbinella massiliensis TaxID=1329796 RepID=UPI0005CC2832|nr:hypothetical protein [Risungbinella massiliensis]